MTPDPPDDLRALLDLARDYLRGREDVRAAVGALGRALAALATWSAPAAEPAPAPSPPEPTPAPGPPPVPVASLPRLTFAPPAPAAPTPHYSGPGDVRPQPLPTIADRCRVKTDAGRFVARRLGGATERSEYVDLIARAGALPDCYLWMLDDHGYADDPRAWDRLADAFAAAALAADMFREWSDLPEPHRGRAASDVLHLAAEAQAVLYAAVAAAGKPNTDGDQRGRVGAVLRRHAGAGRNRQKALANLRYKAGRLADDPAAAAAEWPRVLELVEELVAGGLPPSNVELRDVLVPLAELMPDDLALPPGAGLAFREVDRFLDSRPPADGPRPAAEPWSDEVAEVRGLLAGRQVVLIGGLLRPASRDALVEAFGLEDLLWVSTVEHESVFAFEAPVARPEVAVVLLAIRWSSHSFGDVQRFCDRHGKPLVRLPGGYNPNQVAHQILLQAGQRLRAAG